MHFNFPFFLSDPLTLFSCWAACLLFIDEKNQQKRDDIYSEIEKEENTLREIIYSFPVALVS